MCAAGSARRPESLSRDPVVVVLSYHLPEHLHFSLPVAYRALADMTMLPDDADERDDHEGDKSVVPDFGLSSAAPPAGGAAAFALKDDDQEAWARTMTDASAAADALNRHQFFPGW